MIVIVGSSKKYGIEIYKLAKLIKEQGKFTIDDSEYQPSTKLDRRKLIKRVCDANKILVYNKDGYIGFHTKLEITIAEILGIQIEYLFPKKVIEE